MAFRSYKKNWQFLLNIITAFVISISILFIGILFCYGFFIPMSGGSDITFWEYLCNFFTGNWGTTTIIIPGTPVTEYFSDSLYRMIEFLWFPILIGIIIGISLGRASFKLRGKWANKMPQLFFVLGLSIPVFFIGMMLRYNAVVGVENPSVLMLLFGRLPPSGYKNMMYPDPPFITGFPILDARLSGQILMAIDRIEHLILPILTLTPAIIAFVAWRTRSSMEKKLTEKSILSNTMKTMMIIGFIFSFYILVDLTFNLRGIGDIIRDGIFLGEEYLIIGGVFIFLIISVIMTFISSIVYSFVRFLKFDKREVPKINSPSFQNNEINPKEQNPGNNFRGSLRSYLKNFPIYLYKYPFVFLGLIVVSVLLVFAIFPDLISGYTRAELLMAYPGSWNPPSPGHPMGQTVLGGDVFALVLYGTREALIFGLKAVLIGIVGGLVFGSISSLHRYVNKTIETLMILLFIIPVILFLMLICIYSGLNFWIASITGFTLDAPTLIMGCLLIPIFTRAITSIPLRKRNYLISLKKILIYLPLAIGLIIPIYESLGFIGFLGMIYGSIINWGDQIHIAGGQLYDAAWASFWPGFFILITAFAFILLHYGLKNAFLDKWNSSMLIDNYPQIKEF
ncbi:MAG: hypothetical protein JSV62_06430 [Promethearchaeota archaeon]|nr:MAG: hypothetical protein JSV62_06430 [Candidatus Lokiarchaeota archaeon]